MERRKLSEQIGIGGSNARQNHSILQTWGQGIQKICDECTALGAELPKYEIIGTGLRVYFPALKSALIDQPKVPKGHSAKTDGALDDTMALIHCYT